MRQLHLAAILLTVLFIQSTAFSQPFKLLKDINRGVVYTSPRPRDLVEKGGFLFFRVGTYSNFNYRTNGPAEGIWKSNGSADGTVKIKGVSEFETVEMLAKADDLLFFTVYNFNSATNELWKTDGSENGSSLLSTWPVANTSYSDYRIHSMTSVDGLLYFILRTANEKDELWRSDGTSVGTIFLKSFDHVGNLTRVGHKLLFSAMADATTVPYYQLWKSNGTVAGTTLIKDIGVDRWTDSKSMIDKDGVLFFIGHDAANGSELWKSDGTEIGTVIVKDIEPGPGDSKINDFALANGEIYFFAKTTVNGDGLWKTDGTSARTTMIKDLFDVNEFSSKELTDVNGTLYFQGYDDINGSALWKSDGTEIGTFMLTDSTTSLEGPPSSLFNADGILYFTTYGTQIWKSDGTTTGTVLLKNFEGTGITSLGIEFAMLNRDVFFAAYDQLNGYELRKTDGTTAGTVLVKDIIPTPSSSPQKFTSFEGYVYFCATNNDSGPGYSLGRDLYRTNGTAAGTSFISPNYLGGSDPLDIATTIENLFVSVSSRQEGHELRIVSGDRTVKVKDIFPNQGDYYSPGSFPQNFKSAGSLLYFSANDNSHGRELWKSDGTEEGTVLVKDINLAGDSEPHNLVYVDNIIYFAADNGINGIELWKSDGSVDGTVLLKDINSFGSSSPANLVGMNNILYFTANNGSDGVELWRSDGTEAGTYLLKNIKSGSNSSSPANLVVVNGLLYFSADNGMHGVELWKSDGTANGTVLVKDIRVGNASSNPASIINLNGIAYFSADNGPTGHELWKSDGTTTGTVLVMDIWQGVNGSNPTALTKIGNNILFAANDGISGNEVWLYNSNGARLMSDIERGAGSSNPTEFFEYGSKVLAAATNSLFGAEVWIADIPSDIPTGVEATITPAGPLTFCTGQSVQLKANTGTGYTYQWKKAGVNIAGAIQSNYTAILGGYYTVVVTDAGGISATSEVAIVTVVNAPLATVAAAGPLTFCSGKNVLLKAITGTGYTYQWKKAGVNIDNATQSNYTATSAGIYSVVVTNATGCSTISLPINVTVNNVPLATVAAASALTFCEGRSVQLKAITGTGYTYQWKRGGADIAGAILSNYTATTTGIYNVIVTNAGGCSTASAAFTVVVKPLPVATITPVGSTTFCSGKNVLLKANTGTSYTYKWIRGATVIPDAIQSSYAATTPGQYTVIVTNASGCSVTSAAIPVSVTPLPAALITPAGPLTFCTGQTASLKANTGTNYTYQWKKAGVNIPDATLVSYTASASGVYSVVVTNAAGCSVTSPGVTVTVNSVPLATVVAASATSFCAGKNVLLKAINATGYTYQWRKNGINIPQETTSNYTATATGIYSVVVTNVTGCSTTSIGIGVNVTISPLATVAVAGPLTFCEGKNVLLKAIAAPGYIYQWKKNGINIAAQTQSTYTATTTGVYTVMVTNLEGCSTLSSSINVTVTPAPAASITANGPLTFPKGGNVILNASAAAGNTYQWKKDGVNITGAISESYIATVSGSYTVVITNSSSCQATSLPVQVSVISERLITKGPPNVEESIKIYPNPLHENEYLNIESSLINAQNGLHVTVFDISGRMTDSKILTGYNKKLRIKGSSGVYIVEIRWGENERKIFQIIKI